MNMKNFKRFLKSITLKKQGLNGYMYNFSVDYIAIDFIDIIHKYSMEEHEKKMFRLILQRSITLLSFSSWHG